MLEKSEEVEEQESYITLLTNMVEKNP